MRPSRSVAWFVAVLGLLPIPMLAAVAVATTLLANERSFPFNQELMLDARPMKGSKRVPMMEIGPKGEASIDLWCNTVKAQIVVSQDTITIQTGARTARECEPARMAGDEDVLAALTQATNWRRDGDVLILRGAKTLRFRTATH